MIVDRIALKKRLDRATARLETPIAAVDLAAFDDNAAELVKRAGGKPLRVASKSVRCRALLERVLATPGWHGVMAYTLPEADGLGREGVTDDVLVAYPTGDRTASGEAVPASATVKGRSSGKRFTLRLGQGFRFKDGAVVVKEVDQPGVTTPVCGTPDTDRSSARHGPPAPA